MPLSYKIEDGIVYITVTGKIGVQEQKDFAQEWLSDPTLPSPLKILRDTRKQVGQFGGSLQSLKKNHRFRNELIPTRYAFGNPGKRRLNFWVFQNFSSLVGRDSKRHGLSRQG